MIKNMHATLHSLSQFSFSKSFLVSATLFFCTVANCEKTISLVPLLARSLYIWWIAFTYCWIERIPCGYVQCLDGHNSVNIDAIDLKFESNIVEDICIDWTCCIGLWSIDPQIENETNYYRLIRGLYLSNGCYYKNYIQIVEESIIKCI